MRVQSEGLERGDPPFLVGTLGQNGALVFSDLKNQSDHHPTLQSIAPKVLFGGPLTTHLAYIDKSPKTCYNIISAYVAR